MGQIDWSTPPTEEELGQVSTEASGWDTPPTEAELGIVSQEPATPETPQKKEPSGVVEKTVDFFTEPKEALTTEQLAEADVRTEKAKEEYFKPDTSIQLESSMWPGKSFTNESLKAYRDRRVNEGVKSKSQIDQELKDLGATDTDLRDLNAMRRGVTAPTDVSGENITQPIKRGLAQIGSGLLQVGIDIADALDLEVADEQEVLDLAEADIQSRTKDYEEKYGPNSAGSMLQTATRYAPHAAMMGFAPTSPTLVFLGESAFEYTDSRGQRFDKVQAGASALVVGTVLGKVASLSKGIEGIAKLEFTSLDDLPKNYKKHIETLKRETGMSDEQITETIQAYKESTESGRLTLEDSIRAVAETGNQRATGILHQAIDQSPEAATAIITETTKRSKNVETAIGKNELLAGLFKRNTRFDKGSQATNWSKLYDDAVAKGVPLDSPAMKRIKENADTFNQYDYAAYMKANKPVNLEGEALKAIDQGGVRSSKEGQINATVISLVKDAFRKVFPTGEQKLVNIVENSLREGKINPRKLKADISKLAPDASEADIDEAVEAAVNSVRTAGRPATTEADEAAKAIDANTQNLDESDRLAMQKFKAEQETGTTYTQQQKASQVAQAEQEAGARGRSQEALAKNIAEQEKIALKESNMVAKDLKDDLDALHKALMMESKEESEALAKTIKTKAVNEIKQKSKAMEGASPLEKEILQEDIDDIREVVSKVEGRLAPKKKGEMGIDPVPAEKSSDKGVSAEVRARAETGRMSSWKDEEVKGTKVTFGTIFDKLEGAGYSKENSEQMVGALWEQKTKKAMLDEARLLGIDDIVEEVIKTPKAGLKSPATLDIDQVQNYIGDKVGKSHKALDTALKKIDGDYEGPAIRGMVSNDVAKLDVGDTYKTRGVTSIAKDKDTAKTFADEDFQRKKGARVFIEFEGFKNKPVNIGSGNKLGLVDPVASKEGKAFIEDEVVIPSGRNFEVKSKRVEDGAVYLIVIEK